MAEKAIDANGISTPLKEHGIGPSHVANEKVFVDGVCMERRQSGEDAFTVSDAMREELSIAEGWEPKWIRDDRYWGNKVPGNREYEFRRQNPGGKLVTLDGQPFSNGTDLVLAVIPPETAEAQRKAQEESDREYFKQIERDRNEDDFDPQNTERLRQQRIANSNMHMRNAMIGPHSRTEGLPFDEAERLEERRGVDILQEEMKWARGPRHVDYSDEQAEQIIAQEAPRSGGKTYSLPSNVRPRNLAKT